MRGSRLTLSLLILSGLLIVLLIVLSACSENDEPIPDSTPSQTEIPAGKLGKKAREKIPSREELPIHVVDKGIHKGWELDEAIRVWELATECDLFSTGVSRYPRSRVTVSETSVPRGSSDFEGDDNYWGISIGNFRSVSGSTIKLNGYYGPELSVTLHELGHIAGLDDQTYEPDSIYYYEDGWSANDSTAPYPHDIRLARLYNEERCQR